MTSTSFIRTISSAIRSAPRTGPSSATPTAPSRSMPARSRRERIGNRTGFLPRTDTSRSTSVLTGVRKVFWTDRGGRQRSSKAMALGAEHFSEFAVRCQGMGLGRKCFHDQGHLPTKLMPCSRSACETQQCQSLSPQSAQCAIHVRQHHSAGSRATPLKWEVNIEFWKVLHRIIDSEPAYEPFRNQYGELAVLGIEKGKPFAPDARMTRILEQAAKTGLAQMKVQSFADRRSDRVAWADRKWEWVSLRPENGFFDMATYTDLDAREKWFYQATFESPAMFRCQAGGGSL